jgi:adenosylcobinamide-GDP ribazoletransferase
MYKHTLSALHFLTIIRIGNPGPFEPKAMVPYFPVVGFIIGVMVALFDYCGSFLFNGSIMAVLDASLLAILSGALHLDGLADSADGLFSHRGRERALEIMKDSRVGVMGVVAIVFIMALKIASISGIEQHRRLMLELIPALSRSGIIAATKWMPYGRPQGGTGQAFFETNIPWRAFGGTIPLVILIAIGG